MALLSYGVWLTTSCLSFTLSVLVLLRMFYRSELWGKVFHQLTAALAFVDLFGTSSWFYGIKYKEPFLTCAIEEYMLEGSFLCKGAITVVICYVSIHAVRTMQIPASRAVMSILAIAVTAALFFLAVLISLDSAQVFCSDDYEKYHILAYFMCFILPLYSCIAANLFMYARLHLDIVKLCESRMYGQGSDQINLLILVRKVLFYPLIFSLLLLPEAVAILIYLLSGRGYILSLTLISAACMGLTGTAVALNFFYHQQLLPDIKHLYMYSEGPVNPLSATAGLDKAHVERGTSVREVIMGESTTLRHTEISDAEMGRRSIIEM